MGNRNHLKFSFVNYVYKTQKMTEFASVFCIFGFV